MTPPRQAGPMRRDDRLFEIMGILRDGKLHRAQDLAERLGVTVRTIYRDMEALKDSGVPVRGERGAGYRVQEVVALPPLTLEQAEVEALNLGIAIVSEAADPALSAAARSLAEKIDAALPTRAIAEADQWKYAFHPHASAVRGLSHMGLLRSAIRGRQKLRLSCREGDGRLTRRIVRPLQMDYWGRVWTLIVWSETEADFRTLRVDLVEEATALPELFVDEPGRSLDDFLARQAAGRRG